MVHSIPPQSPHDPIHPEDHSGVSGAQPSDRAPAPSSTVPQLLQDMTNLISNQAALDILFGQPPLTNTQFKPAMLDMVTSVHNMWNLISGCDPQTPPTGWPGTAAQWDNMYASIRVSADPKYTGGDYPEIINEIKAIPDSSDYFDVGKYINFATGGAMANFAAQMLGYGMPSDRIPNTAYGIMLSGNINPDYVQVFKAEAHQVLDDVNTAPWKCVAACHALANVLQGHLNSGLGYEIEDASQNVINFLNAVPNNLSINFYHMLSQSVQFVTELWNSPNASSWNTLTNFGDPATYLETVYPSSSDDLLSIMACYMSGYSDPSNLPKAFPYLEKLAGSWPQVPGDVQDALNGLISNL